MELYIAGGCSEHGRNCFLVKGENLSFLVDAGLMKEKPEVPYPDLTEEQIGGADYLFLTHAHSDHAGALPWLLKHGFRGVVVASRPTFDTIPAFRGRRKTLEDLSGPLEECMLSGGIAVTWGRSGHCFGSVWYRFRAEGRRLVFTGDYEEESLAYRCDRIRDVEADLAVVDCAYGVETENASVNRDRARKAVRHWRKKAVPLFFPVPANGRGLDVIRLLADAGVPVVFPEETASRLRDTPETRFWLKKGFLHSAASLRRADGKEFASFLSEWEKGPAAFPRGLRRAAILVSDSQLARPENRKAADAVTAAGGQVILTGKQDPASCAKRLLTEHRAEFDRLSVHQNAEEMEALDKKNRFRYVIPYHSRQSLRFDDRRILVLETGDRVKF